MIWPQFSEFSFGYAFTDNLVNRVLTGIKGVPIFPSLKQEGRAGGGYDVKIPTRSAPVFLQFKLPQIVKRHRSVWKHDLVAPYYRIHLMRRSHSPQHLSLLRHAQHGRMVFYVAPEFDRRSELNDLYQKGAVPLRSAYFDPKDIGQIDDAPHHIAYRAGLGEAWLCSAPRRLKRQTGPDIFLQEVRRLAADAPAITEPNFFFDSLAAEIIASALKAEFEETEEAGGDADTSEFPEFLDPRFEMRRLSPFRERFGAGRFAAYVARLYLDCELIIVGRDK